MAAKTVPIQLKRSAVAANVPLAGNLLTGELAINTADKKLYSKDATAVFQVAPSLAEHNTKAPLASPALTGTPTAPTAAAGTNTTQLATTAFVKTAVDGLVNAAPGALDTINELAAALGNDASFSSTVTASIATKAPLASPALTGTPTAPTATAGTNTTQLATTAFVTGAVAGKEASFDGIDGGTY